MINQNISNCITGDSLVYVNGNLVPIKKIWNNFNNGRIIEEEDGAEWCGIENGMKLYVNSYDQFEKRITEDKIIKLYRQPISEKIKEITLENGLKLKMTNQHRVLLKNGKNYNWVKYLKIGDSICIPKNMVNTKQNDISNIAGYDALKGIINENIIPNFVMDADLTKIRQFLKYYFNKHAIINEINATISVISKSYMIIMQLWCLLKLFGISSLLNETNDILYITCRNMELFEKYIGFSDVGKASILKRICDANCDTEFELKDELEYIKIKYIRTIQYDDYVYDLEIKRHHNYVVNGILCS